MLAQPTKAYPRLRGLQFRRLVLPQNDGFSGTQSYERYARVDFSGISYLKGKPHAGNTPSQTDLIFVAVDLQQLSTINKEHENQEHTYLKHNCKNC